MKIIKRNGSEENFDVSKISAAVAKANKACEKGAISAEEIEDVADYVEYKCNKMNRAVSVEEIQDISQQQLSLHAPFHHSFRQDS